MLAVSKDLYWMSSIEQRIETLVLFISCTSSFIGAYGFSALILFSWIILQLLTYGSHKHIPITKANIFSSKSYLVYMVKSCWVLSPPFRLNLMFFKRRANWIRGKFFKRCWGNLHTNFDVYMLDDRNLSHFTLFPALIIHYRASFELTPSSKVAFQNVIYEL